jgi:hypothetical protein
MSKVVATNRGDHLSEALIKHIISQMRGQADLPPALLTRLGSASEGVGKRRRKKKHQVSLEDIGGGPESEHYKSIS